MERRRHRRFAVHLPVVAEHRGHPVPGAYVSNPSAGGRFLVIDSGGERPRRSLDDYVGSEIKVNISVAPDEDAADYSVPFSVVRANGFELGLAYSDASLARMLTPGMEENP